jgi:TolA-binding protein
MRRDASWRWLLAAALLGSSSPALLRADPPLGEVNSDASRSLAGSVNQGLEWLAAGRLEDAAAALATFVADHPDHPHAPRAMCGAGQALERLGRHREALEFFEGVLVLQRATTDLDVALVELSAARSAMQLGDSTCAIGHCAAAREHLRQRSGADQPKLLASTYRMQVATHHAAGQFEMAWKLVEEAAGLQEITDEDLLELALECGIASLTGGQAGVAYAAFRWYLDHADPNAPVPQALAGIGWAAALQGDQPDVAAQLLTAYAERYPEQADVPRALLAAAHCYQEAQRGDLAIAILSQIASQYAKSDEAPEALVYLITLAQSLQQPDRAYEARRQLITDYREHPKADADAVQSAAAALLLSAADRQDVQSVDAAIVALATIARDGAAIASTLQELDEAEHHVLAIELAQRILAQAIDDPPIDPRSPRCWSACRYLSSGGQWSAIIPFAQAAHRDPTARDAMPMAFAWMLAESLTHGNDIAQGQAWYRRLAAQQQDDQAVHFAILTRVAELALESEGVEAVNDAIESLAKAATEPAQRAVIEILRSQADVRRGDLVVARQRMEQLVRSGIDRDDLRARAQWMIGQTHHLQENFVEAIEAYRRVPGFQPDGQWQPLALLEAGKCFEELGQLREAVTCYTGLLERHAQSTHAPVAKSRLEKLR